MTDFIELARRMDELARIGNDTSAKMDRLVNAFLERSPLPQLDDAIVTLDATTSNLNNALAQYHRLLPK